MIENVNTLRERIAKLKGEIEDLELGVATRDEAADRLERWVDDQAERVNLQSMVAKACVNTESVDGEPFHIDARVSVDGAVAEADMGSLLAWVAGDVLKERLLAKLDEMAPDHCSNKDTSARRAALTKKLKQLDQLERDEEAEICEAERAGYNVARRRDCRPEIVLALEAA